MAASPSFRPRSAVSHGVGIAGMAGLIAWVAIAWVYGLDGPYGAIVAVIACGLPMVGWSLLVDRVHRNPSTGIDWDRPPARLRETLEISLTKLAGYWVTWGLIAAVYAIERLYWQGQYLQAMTFLEAVAPALLVLSVPYVFWLDRRLKNPRDGAWAFGQWLVGQARPEDMPLVTEHLRSWAVKGFFTAFMISIVPGNYADMIHWRADAGLLHDPVALSRTLISFMFLIDVAFATVGYLLTMKPLDAHIRSANPYAAGWMAALICYPPFIMMGEGRPLDYHPGTADWTYWFDGRPTILALLGLALVLLTAAYAWATVAFGLRFSNLTDRGILTHGPYRWTKHPAYLAKNSFWWLSTLPFLATSGSYTDMVRNTVMLGLVSGVYYWRARTEERHLMADPVYVEYAAWMEAHAPLPRLWRWLKGAPRRTAGAVPAE